MGYRPVQEYLQQLYDALGLPLPQDILSTPWFAKQDNGLSPGSGTTKVFQSSLALDSGYSPIHRAATDGSVTDIELILGSDLSQLDKKNNDGDTPLITAYQAGNLPVAQFLIDKGADCSAKNNLGESCIHWTWAFDASRLTRYRILHDTKRGRSKCHCQ